MFQRFLTLLLVNAFSIIFVSAVLYAGDYLPKNIDETEKLYEVRSLIRMKIDERVAQPSSHISKKERQSLETFIASHACYFCNMALNEQVPSSSVSSKTLKSSYDDFLDLIIDSFVEMPKNWHTFYDFGIARELKYGLLGGSYPFKFVAPCDLEFVSKRITKLKKNIFKIPLDARDSVCWYVTQTVLNYKSCPVLPDLNHLLKLVCEIPKEHRHVILGENMLYPDHRVEEWLRAVRQANMAEYYAPLMYKFIPFLDSKCFWSIFIFHSNLVPTEKHLRNAFDLFYERITGAYMLPRSHEAAETLRAYLQPWFPVSLLCALRFSKVPKLCW